MALPHLNSYSRKPSCKEIYLNKAGLDHIEIALLKIIRFFLQTYALDASHSWILAFKASEKYFGKEKGARIWCATYVSTTGNAICAKLNFFI